MPDKNTLEQAFSTAYGEHAAAVYRHIRIRVARSEDAEDMTAQTFMKTWEYMAERRGRILRMKAFLFRVANNLIVDWYRGKHKEPLPMEDIEEEAEVRAVDARLDDILDARANVEELSRALGMLDPPYRDVLVLHHVEELTIPEIAKKLDVSENVVYVRMHRGRKKLLEIFQTV